MLVDMECRSLAEHSLPRLTHGRSSSVDCPKVASLTSPTSDTSDTSMPVTTMSKFAKSALQLDLERHSVNENSDYSTRQRNAVKAGRERKRSKSVPVQEAESSYHLQGAAQSRLSDVSFRRQSESPIQISREEMCMIRLRSEVPKATISRIHLGEEMAAKEALVAAGVISVQSPDDFSKAFCEDVPSFMFVANDEESAALAADMLRSQHQVTANAVIVVLMGVETSASKAIIEQLVPNLITSGADDVVVLPTCITQLSYLATLLCASLAKAKAGRQRIKSVEKERQDCKQQCHSLFWSVAHVVIPGFPAVEEQHVEVCEKRIGDITLEKKLGEGHFATVYAWQHGDDTGAVKVIPKKRIRFAENCAQIAAEFECLKKLSHPNIVKVLGIVHAKQNLYLFMEVAGVSSLFEAIRIAGKEGLPLARAADIFAQIAFAAAHCHDKNVAHGDMKPENIMMSSDGCATLVDFGLAVDFTEEIPSLDLPRGTMPFIPPEIMKASETWDPAAADVWSLGVVFLEMLCGNHGFARLFGWQSKHMKRGPERARRAEEVVSFFAQIHTEAGGKAVELVTSRCKNPTPPAMLQLLFDMLQVEPSRRVKASAAAKRAAEIMQGL